SPSGLNRQVGRPKNRTDCDLFARYEFIEIQQNTTDRNPRCRFLCSRPRRNSCRSERCGRVWLVRESFPLLNKEISKTSEFTRVWFPPYGRFNASRQSLTVIVGNLFKQSCGKTARELEKCFVIGQRQ